MGFRLIDICGKRITCDVCNGTACDHCGDRGWNACPDETGSYRHDVAERGEVCAECGESVHGDILRSTHVPSADGPAYLRQPLGWHVACR